jgi:MFS family permease
MSETFGSLRIRNFRLFFVGQTISQVGNWLTSVAQALLVLKLTHNNGVAVGVLTACQFLPVLVIGAWTGVVADRRDKRKLLLGIQTVAMVQSFMLSALAFMHRPPLLALYGVALFGGFATAFDNPARRAFVVEMVPDDHVQNAVSLNSALMTGSRLFGPALAGILIVTVGYGWCFFVDGVSYLAVLWGLWAMNPAELRPARKMPYAKGQVRAGLAYARSVPDLWVPLVMTALIGTFAFNFAVVMPLFVKKTLHHSDTAFTWLFSVVSVGSLAGALLSARRKKSSLRDVTVGAAMFGSALLAMVFSPNLATSYPIVIFMGFASIVFMTASTSIVQMKAIPEMRGRVLALQAIVFMGTTPIGGPIVGAVCQAWGARTGFLLGSIAALMAAGWGWWCGRPSSTDPTSEPSNVESLRGATA